MAESTTTRFGAHRWSAESDTPSRDEFDSTHAQLEALGVGYTENTMANRPAPGKHGWFFWATDTGHLYYDTGTAWLPVNIDFGADADTTVSLPGDLAAHGSTGKLADAGHVHGREQFGSVVALTKFGLAVTSGSGTSVARANHSHGTPAILNGGAALAARSALNFVIPAAVGAVSDDAANDRTLVTLLAQAIAIPFHIGNGITVGLKKPKWIAPVNCTILLARAVLDAGSGVTYQLYEDGANATGAASAAVGTAVVTTDFADFNVDAGHYVQVNVVNAGAAASDLSVTAYAIPR